MIFNLITSLTNLEVPDSDSEKYLIISEQRLGTTCVVATCVVAFLAPRMLSPAHNWSRSFGYTTKWSFYGFSWWKQWVWCTFKCSGWLSLHSAASRNHAVTLFFIGIRKSKHPPHWHSPILHSRHIKYSYIGGAMNGTPLLPWSNPIAIKLPTWRQIYT